MKTYKLVYDIIFTIVGWIITLISVFIIDSIPDILKYILLSLVIVLSIMYIFWEVNLYKKSNENISVHRTKEEVNEYLYNWIKKGARTVIFTRDLTWVDESNEIFKLLERKAEKKELSICLFRNTKTTNSLKKAGAEIYVHNIPESQLKSRFTIIDYNTNNPKITVGFKKSDGSIINEQYDMTSNPNACSAFIEMFELVKNNSEINNKNLV